MKDGFKEKVAPNPSSPAHCDQCKRTDVEEVELREGIYFFKGVLCPKHAAEWRVHFENIMKDKRS